VSGRYAVTDLCVNIEKWYLKKYISIQVFFCTHVCGASTPVGTVRSVSHIFNMCNIICKGRYLTVPHAASILHWKLAVRQPQGKQWHYKASPILTHLHDRLKAVWPIGSSEAGSCRRSYCPLCPPRPPVGGGGVSRGPSRCNATWHCP
jgi:hypothetical protein